MPTIVPVFTALGGGFTEKVLVSSVKILESVEVGTIVAVDDILIIDEGTISNEVRINEPVYIVRDTVVSYSHLKWLP